MANEVSSLALYASLAKNANVSQAALKGCADYHAFLTASVNLPIAGMIWSTVFPKDPLVPLASIGLAQTDYLDIVDQLFQGVPFNQVRLSAVAAPLRKPSHSPYFPKYLATLKGDSRTGPAVEATLGRIDDFVSNGSVGAARTSGLVVGRVQSGKTRNYIGLALKAVDEGWNVVIVLTSAIKALAKQTRNRIDAEFKSAGIDRAHACELDFLGKGNANQAAGAELDGDFFYWGVSMKQVDGLGRILSWLDLPRQPHASMRVLIVDDESDNATPDSSADDEPNLDAHEIDERIHVIRRDPAFAQLADWFDSLVLATWPDPNGKTTDARVFKNICDILSGPGSAKKKRDQIVAPKDIRDLLGMGNFQNPPDPVEKQIPKFFFNTRGDDDNSCAAFVLLLRSILDVSRDRSAINAAVCRLVGPDPETGRYAYPFGRCAYVGYTATPYANILNEGPGQTPLYPDFIQSLFIPPQYFGVEAIFGLDPSAPAPRMPIVETVPEPEEDRILLPLRAAGIPNVDTGLVCHDASGPIEWTGLKQAIAWGFCAAAVRRRRRLGMADPDKRALTENRWTTLLVNVDHKQPSHEAVRAVLDRYLDAQCASPATVRQFLDDCRDVWNAQTAKFPLKTFNDLFNSDADPSKNYGPVDDYPDWNDVRREIEWFLGNRAGHVHAVVLNSTRTGTENQLLYAQDPDDIANNGVMQLDGDHLWLVSGGNSISRGLTLHGLSASYFDRVRERTCVDTVTQMGRWFGYRGGYELIPRIWTPLDALLEMKRIALLETKLHESIDDNFRQGFSPADPAHFQQISCWGRQLSGRDAASRRLDADIGTTASTDDFFTDPQKRRHVYSLSERFLLSLGPGKQRDPKDYPYAATPLWETVSRLDVSRFLDSLSSHCPDRSRKILRGLVRDIRASDPVDWDVVLGNPDISDPARQIRFAGCDVRFGAAASVPAGPGVVRTSSARLHGSFYAMIPGESIYREDLAALKAWRVRVADAIDARRIQNGGSLPKHYDAALPGPAQDTVQDRLDRLIADLEGKNGSVPLPEAIHARLGDVSQGLRNRASAEYMARVHRNAGHVRPVLQLYLVYPDGVNDGADPLVNVSFYWPDHEPTGFFSVAVEQNPDAARMVSTGGFCQTVEDILNDPARDFPMQRKELLRAVLAQLGARCTEAFFDQHVANPPPGYKYHKMKGRNAYCRDGWAVDEEARLDSKLLQAAVDVLLRDRTPYATKDLLDKVVTEQPRFRDFFVPGRDNARLNALMTPAVLTANNIAVTCRRPVTYQA